MEDAELTKRESEIAELFAWGASKKDIANRLFISERTVENHARNIYAKIGCQKVNELSAWWFCTRFHIPFELSPMTKKILNKISMTKNYIKRIIKEITGGQDLTIRQRLIAMWWALSLCFTCLFAECLWLCGLCLVSFAIASHYVKQIPIKDEEEEAADL